MHESLFSNPRTWVAIAFVLFVVLFGARLWRTLTSILDARANAIRAELDEVARLRREAEAMLRTATAERDAAASEAAALLAGAQAEAARVTEQGRADAQASGARRERMAMDRIAAAEKAAVAEVRAAAIDVATRAAQQVIARDLTPEADAALVDRAIAALPQAMAKRAA
jgi:F-type H+-transporting ATPase subunit b